MSVRVSAKRARALSPLNANVMVDDQSNLFTTKATIHTDAKLANKHANDREHSTPTSGNAPVKHLDVQPIKMSPVLRPFADLAGIVVELEGNIGSGKSTLSRLLRDMIRLETEDDDSCTVFYESINNDFLGAFYQNIKRYSFAFQMYMLTTRLYSMDEGYRQAAQENRLVLLDRGAVGDTVFALLNHQMGNMDDEEIKIYKSVCQQRMPHSISERVDVVLYLDVDPNECHRRVTKERKNDAEEGIPLSYLDAVDNCYFHLLIDWFGNRKASFNDLNIGKSPKVVVMRWDKYGDCRDAVRNLQSIVADVRKSPTINFVTEKPQLEDNTYVFDTIEDINNAFKTLQDTDHVSNNLYTKAHINWELDHTNAFRRVSMYFLAHQGTATFYGKGAISDTHV